LNLILVVQIQQIQQIIKKLYGITTHLQTIQQIITIIIITIITIITIIKVTINPILAIKIINQTIYWTLILVLYQLPQTTHLIMETAIIITITTLEILTLLIQITAIKTTTRIKIPIITLIRTTITIIKVTNPIVISFWTKYMLKV